MKIITTNKFNLVPLALPFAYSFVWNCKRGEEIAWFTPSGKAKIWFGGIQIKDIGTITDETNKKIVKEMIKAKADVLWNKDNSWLSEKRYTLASSGLAECLNINEVLEKLTNEWNNRHEYEDWESL
jgi:hypothetical protein